MRSLPGSSPAAPPENPAQPWLRSVGLAVSTGTLSSSAADAIRIGLGSPSDSVPSSAWATAAEHLCVVATTLDADRLTILARQLRDEIDEAGITDREQARHTARSLRLVRQVNRMTRLVWVMDPETAATITDLYDRATSPKRDAPRFVDGGDSTTADHILSGNRSTEQLASDTSTNLLHHGATTEPTRLLDPAARPGAHHHRGTTGTRRVHPNDHPQYGTGHR